ncbi:MAG: hydroxyphenylacetyl-CoA thioesterase PaaI [Balneolaceae bacterium]
MLKKDPEKNVQHMYDNDAFSKWLGIKILEVNEGYVKLEMKVRSEMTNGFDIAHGGIAFSLADSALAFAAGTYGRISPALNNTISFIKPVAAGDRITAIAEQLHLGRQTGVYNITIRNQNNKIVAVMRGTVFRTERKLDGEI